MRHNIFLNKGLVIAIISIFLIFSCQKQDDMIEVIGTSNNLSFYEQYVANFNINPNPNNILIATDDGGGIYCNYNSEFLFGVDYETGITIKRVDAVGIVEWECLFEFESKGLSVEHIVLLSDGSVALTGTAETPVYLNEEHTSNYFKQQAFAGKINANGEVAWRKIYDILKRSFGNTICETKDGGFAIAGSALDTGSDIDFPLGPTTELATLMKIDKNGELDWYKTYENRTKAKEVIQTSDEGYIVSFSGDKIMKTDSDGNISSEISMPDESFWAENIIKANDEGFVLNYFFKKDNATALAFLKMNEAGEIMWHKEHMIQGSVYFTVDEIDALDVYYILNTGYIALYRKDILDGKLGLKPTEYAFLKLNNDGELIN